MPIASSKTRQDSETANQTADDDDGEGWRVADEAAETQAAGGRRLWRLSREVEEEKENCASDFFMANLIAVPDHF